MNQATQPPNPTGDLYTLIKTLCNRLDAIASQTPPDWKLPLAYYKYNWSAKVGATVIDSDGHGPSQVSWAGHTYTRRSGAGKYGAAIWFSRSIGKDDNGETEYGRLITFKDQAPAEPLEHGVVDALSRSRPQQTVTPTR
jgi:hypothetical protein